MNTNHIPRFKIEGLQQGKESVVGNCNGHSCEERWNEETPLFARAILRHLPKGATSILDYGCGVGRLAKEILKQNPKVTVIGVDASLDELAAARQYVADSRFVSVTPEEIPHKVDLVYCIYVLQHVPAVELRHAIERMHYFLKPGGKLVYCSSDYRMAINSGGGFTDDRHLGVDIRKELSRLFQEEGEMFELETAPKIIRDMVTAKGCPAGSISHPAKVFKRRSLKLDADQPYFKAGFPVSEGGAEEMPHENEQRGVKQDSDAPRRLILRNRLSPGDVLVMTAAIRSLHKAYPGKYLTDVDTPCSEIFENNPNITNLEGDGQVIDMHYPAISDYNADGFHHHGAGVSGRHFSDGHRKFLEGILECEIPRTGLVPDLFLSQDERLWPSPVLKECAFNGPYWVLNAGSKSDYTLKQYHRYQEVVDSLVAKWGEKIKIVQIGHLDHNHPPLKGVLDMRGKTTHRELFRLVYHAEGVITCVSYPMHIAAALSKPAVVIPGGRESARWEYYPNQRYLAMNGALACCSYDGCWKSKIEECALPVETNVGTAPKCLEMTKPSMIVEAIETYYEGGILAMPETKSKVIKKRKKAHV